LPEHVEVVRPLVRVAHSLVVGVVPHDARAAQLPRCSRGRGAPRRGVLTRPGVFKDAAIYNR
jgi:hypothetical protein